MKRAIIVHCWGGKPEYCWYPWAKKELEKRNFEVEVPEFPDTDNPKLSKWLPILQKIIGQPDEELYLIGHSLGCPTIMRYLETLEGDEKIGGAIFVAGFTEDLGFSEIKNFFETPLNFSKIKNRIKNGIIAIQSDNDPYVDLRFIDELREKLDAKVIVKHNAYHFSGASGDRGACTQLPDVIEAVSSII